MLTVPLSGVAGMLRTRLLLAHPSFWTARTPAHRARASRLGPCERRARHEGLGRRFPQAGTQEAVGTRWMGTGCVERRYEGHGEAARPTPWPPPGHHSGGERSILVVLAARQCAGRHLLHGLHERAALLGEKARNTAPEGSSIYASTWRRIWERIDQIGPHPIHDDAARAQWHDHAGAAAGERAGGREGEDRLGSSPVCRTVRAELPQKGHALGLVGRVPGPSSRLRGIQRIGATLRAWCRGSVVLKLVVGTAKEEDRTLTLAKTGRVAVVAQRAQF